MSEILGFFREGGWPMYAVVGTDLCLLMAVAVGLVVSLLARGHIAAKVFGALLLVGALTPLLVGIGGYLLGMSRVEAVIGLVEPEYRDQVRTAGTAEAMHNVQLGGGSLLCTLPAALLVAGVAFRGKKIVA